MAEDTAGPMPAEGTSNQAVAAERSDNTLSASRISMNSGSNIETLSGSGLKAIVTRPQQHEHQQQEHEQQQQQEQKRRTRRGPLCIVTGPARAVGSKLKNVVSRKQQQLRDLDKDALCLQTVNALLPAQVVDELREQLREGSSHVAAVEKVSKKRLSKLAGADVGKVFLGLAGTASAGCGVVHATKGLVCLVVKPLRLRRPLGLVINNVIMPTSVYGPLLGAYVVVMTARGALRQLAAETEVDPAKQLAAAAATPAAVAAVLSDSESVTPSHKGEITAKRIAQYQAAVHTSSGSISEKQLASASRLASSSSSPAPLQQQQQANEQQQQQQKADKQGSKSWWSLLKKQRSAPAAAIAAAAAPAGAPAEAPASSDDLVQSCDLDHTAAHSSSTSSSSSSSGPTPLPAPKGPSTPPTPGRREAAAAAAAAAALAAAAAAEPVNSPKLLGATSDSNSQQIPALPAVEPCNVQLRHITEPPQQQQQQDDTPASAFEAAAAAGDSDSPHHSDLVTALRPTQINAADTTHHSDHLPEVILAPVGNLGHVSKLQRRWSSHDGDLIDDRFRSGLAQAPFRPPVFSRLPSGRGGCRITSAAAAVTENECSGECCADATAAAAAAGDVDAGVSRTVSLDMTTAVRRATVIQQQQQQQHEQDLVDTADSVLVASPRASPNVEIHTPTVSTQQLQHHTRLYKSMDWGHKLPALPAQETA